MTTLLPAAFVAAAAVASAASGFSRTQAQTTDSYSKDWKRLRSEHFVAAGNAGYIAMRSVLMELEGFRRALLRSFPSLRVASRVPTTVIVFRDDESFSRFKPRDGAGRRRDRVAGYFLSGPGANYLVVPMHRNAARTFHYLFHEYTHFIVRHNLGDVPEWLNEGLAELYSTFRAMPRQGRSILGEPPQNRLPLLYGRQLLLRDLLTMNSEDRSRATAQTQQRFYAQAWALVHFLHLGDGGRHRAGIAAYLAALEKNPSVESAVVSAFGMPLEALESAVVRYGQRTSFPQQVIEDPQDGVRVRTSLEAMLEREVAELQQELITMLERASAPHQ